MHTDQERRTFTKSVFIGVHLWLLFFESMLCSVFDPWLFLILGFHPICGFQNSNFGRTG